MRSLLAVTTPAAETALTTIARFRNEIGAHDVDAEEDALIAAKIDEASAAIDNWLRRTLAREVVSETFRLDPGEAPETLRLERWPVVSVASAAEDGVTVAAAEYELDADAGLLHRLDASGYRNIWVAAKSIVVAYTAGYKMPAESGRTLPADLELAALMLVRSWWHGRARDPLVRAESIPGLRDVTYWVGGAGSGPLPPEVEALLGPYRRAMV